MKKSQNMLMANRHYNLLITFMGIVSTMPIVTIGIGSSRLSLFSIVFFLFVAYSLCIVITQKKFSFVCGRIKKILFLFMAWSIVSYLAGLIYMPSDWQSYMTSNVMKSGEYIMAFLLICLIDDRKSCESYAKGLIIGCSINAAWSIAELFVFTVLHKSLNNMIFVERLANLDRSSIIYNQYGGVRVSGLNYDPAHLGGLVPTLLFFGLYSKNGLLISLSALSLIASQSSTCLLGCGVVFMAYLIYRYIYKSMQSRKSNHSQKNIVVLVMIFIFIVVLLVVFVLTNSQIRETIFNAFQNNFNGFIGRIGNTYIRNESTNFHVNPRKVYYGKMLDALLSRNPASALVGTGLGTSMYAYRDYVPRGVPAGSGEPDVTYIDYLFDLGIIGLCLYIVFLVFSCVGLVKNIRQIKNNLTVVYLGVVINLIVISFTYHYVFTVYQMLAFMFLALQLDKSYNSVYAEDIK